MQIAFTQNYEPLMKKENFLNITKTFLNFIVEIFEKK